MSNKTFNIVPVDQAGNPESGRNIQEQYEQYLGGLHCGSTKKIGTQMQYYIERTVLAAPHENQIVVGWTDSFNPDNEEVEIYDEKFFDSNDIKEAVGYADFLVAEYYRPKDNS